MTSKQARNPQDDFQHIINNLFEKDFDDANNERPFTRPKILWSCFFSIPESSNLDISTNLPENMYLCSGPDLDLDYDSSIKQVCV